MADCTVVRFIKGMVVVRIVGIEVEMGVYNGRFSQVTRPPQWRLMNEDMLASMSSECGRCGSDKTRVLTKTTDARLYDGDLIECLDCKHNGTISVVDCDAFCAWDEMPECDWADENRAPDPPNVQGMARRDGRPPCQDG